jgi:DHA3 family macrolide efflux protein-like MFS transporter
LQEATVIQYAQVLKHPHLSGLWLSQVLSAIGDQLYSIAMIWMAVELGGPAAGLVVASGAISGFVFGLFGGVYADRWNRRATMILVDVLRAIVVLCLAAAAHCTPLNLWHLGIASVLVSGLGALFDPAITASLPELVKDESKLQTMNALMTMNHRVARAVGPALAGWLVAVTELHHFFTLDAITFIVSAIAIFSIGSKYRWQPEQTHTHHGLAGIWADISRGAKIVLEREQILWAFLIYVGANIAWAAGYLVGLPLLVKQLPHADVGTYGTIIAAYGVGSISSNIVMGTVSSSKKMAFVSISQLIFAIGFLMLAFSNNVWLACFASLFAASGGPVGDVMLMVMLQTGIPRNDLGKVFALRQCVMYLGGAVGLFFATELFKACSPMMGIAISAGLFLLLGIAGLMKFGFVEFPHHLYDSRETAPTEIAPTEKAPTETAPTETDSIQSAAKK